MTSSFNPALDLKIERIIKGPRSVVWSAWTDPKSFEQWWVPAPTRCRVDEMDVRPGGGLVTRMSENGSAFVPHLTACYLAVDEGQRIVFTNTMASGWRPVEEPFVAITAIISLADHPQGTEYIAHVMHRSAADSGRHEELGFHEGWGTVTTQLVALIERQVRESR
jgi:uncharacterized protein YndB with AHSA1/START domain